MLGPGLYVSSGFLLVSAERDRTPLARGFEQDRADAIGNRMLGQESIQGLGANPPAMGTYTRSFQKGLQTEGSCTVSARPSDLARSWPHGTGCVVSVAGFLLRHPT